MDNEADPVEQYLQTEIRKLDEAIQGLSRDRETLVRQLTAHRLRYSPDHATKRKNSSQRIIVEGQILATLEQLKQTRNRVLYRAAKEAFPDLNYSTFRVYLYRLKARKLIEPGMKNGHWRLPKKDDGNPIDQPLPVAYGQPERSKEEA